MTSAPHVDRLSRRARWLLALLGGALGAVIGPTGFWLRGIEATERLRARSGRAAELGVVDINALAAGVGSHPIQLVFMLLAFGATLVVMPFLIRWLERRVDEPVSRYYPGSVVSGIVSGTAATVLTATWIFLTILVVGFVNPQYAATVQEPMTGATVAGLLAGAAVFAPAVGLVTPFLYVKWIVLFGVPFGLLFGLLVRRLARRP